MSETKLPYDVVYILNKYFKFVVESIEDNGGRVDKFIGDGVMAIFDISNNMNENCKNALVASRNISKSLKLLNEELKSELDGDLKIGIGVHAGTVILGKMGFGVPFGTWCRADLREYLSDFLLVGRPLCADYLSLDYVRQLITRHLDGQADLGLQLWSILCFEQWLRILPDWRRNSTVAANNGSIVC